MTGVEIAFISAIAVCTIAIFVLLYLLRPL